TCADISRLSPPPGGGGGQGQIWGLRGGGVCEGLKMKITAQTDRGSFLLC
ncbi:hypothetical protein NDU88_008053, partial [Pleurodeles waltl]